MRFSVEFPLAKCSTYVELEDRDCASYEDVNASFGLDLPADAFYYVVDGLILGPGDIVEDGQHVDVRLRLRGGKGGFGSMLRAIGAQIEKTTNKEACRDLSGRRLRDINEEKRLKEWLAKQSEREEDVVARKRARLEKLTALPKHDFKDADYDRMRKELPDRVYDSVEKALASEKRKITDEFDVGPTGPSKKKKGMLSNPLGGSDSEVSSSEDEEIPELGLKALEGPSAGEIAAMDFETMVSTILKQASSAKDLESLGVDYLQLLVERRGLKCVSNEVKILAEVVFQSVKAEEGERE